MRLGGRSGKRRSGRSNGSGRRRRRRRQRRTQRRRRGQRPGCPAPLRPFHLRHLLYCTTRSGAWKGAPAASPPRPPTAAVPAHADPVTAARPAPCPAGSAPAQRDASHTAHLHDRGYAKWDKYDADEEARKVDEAPDEQTAPPHAKEGTVQIPVAPPSQHAPGDEGDPIARLARRVEELERAGDRSSGACGGGGDARDAPATGGEDGGAGGTPE